MLLLAAPAAADDWVHYTNSAYGFELDIPPGFVEQAESENGQVFRGSTAEITVSAGVIAARDFEAQAAAQWQEDADDGWGLWFKNSTPQSASHGGKKGDRQMWTGLIPVCGGSAYVEVTVTFGSIDAVAMQRPVSRMERSLRDTGSCSAI
jgi:hypothetical protein